MDGERDRIENQFLQKCYTNRRTQHLPYSLIPRSLIQRVLSNFPPNERYLVGVSGGRDSVALLHWLLAQGYARLIVCHLDHGLRGRSSRADARFVERLAEKWELPCEIARMEVGQSAAQKKLSLETAGRDARLDFFRKVARRRRCLTIFLAHHADDQVETFLLKLFRGAGGRGLGAMREISENGALRIVRPWLGLWRAEIDAYIAEHGLKFREDASNAEIGPRRNLLRHALIPELEKRFGRKVRANLWRTASILAEEDAFLEAMLPNEFAVAEMLNVKELTALPLVLQRRAILRWLRARGVSDVGFEVIEKVRGLIQPETRISRTNLPRARFVRRRAGKLFIEEAEGKRRR